jgi:hypothetical protein
VGSRQIAVPTNNYVIFAVFPCLLKRFSFSMKKQSNRNHFVIVFEVTVMNRNSTGGFRTERDGAIRLGFAG